MSVSKRDRVADEFGTAPLAELFGGSPEQPQPANVREHAIGNLETMIAHGSIIPLGDRQPIEDDPMFPRAFQEEWYGSRGNGPTIPEQQQLRREYTGLIDDVINSRMQGEQLANVMWSEFRSAHPGLCADPSRVEAAARRVMEAGGFDPDNRGTFYERVAKQLGGGDD